MVFLDSNQPAPSPTLATTFPRIARAVEDMAAGDDDPFWQKASTARMVIRMQEEAADAQQRAKTQEEKLRLARFYSRDSMARRLKLMVHPTIQAALDRVWECADSDHSGFISRVEYMVLHRKVTLALDPTTLPQKAFTSAREDWLKDSEGRPKGLDKERFVRSWFELADLWTDSLEPEAYVYFLQTMIGALTRTAPTGEVEWATDRQVINSHFVMLRGGPEVTSVANLAVAESMRRRMVLALWHEEIEREAILTAARRARRAANAFKAARDAASPGPNVRVSGDDARGKEGEGSGGGAADERGPWQLRNGCASSRGAAAAAASVARVRSVGQMYTPTQSNQRGPPWHLASPSGECIVYTATAP